MARWPDLFGPLINGLRRIRKSAATDTSSIDDTSADSDDPSSQEVHLPVVERVASNELQSTLESIVYDVVNVLGYAIGLVATYEEGDALPLRAYYVDPAIASMEQIHQWEAMISKFSSYPISLSDPLIARTYIYDQAYAHNLSYLAAHKRTAVESSDLFSLFTPIAPLASKPVAELIQHTVGIKAVIAIPFFLETMVGGKAEPEMVGNLFAAKRDSFTIEDRRILAALGRQAAAAILSERRRVQNEIVQGLVYNIQTSLQDEHELLGHIVQGVVRDLGYALAMVATYMPDGTMHVRSLYIDPQLINPTWERAHDQLQKARFAFVLTQDSDNLLVKATQREQVQFSQSLTDAFAPHASDELMRIIEALQQSLGIQKIAAVPFSLTPSDTRLAGRVVGALCSVTRSRRFNFGEIELLQAFAQQAAAGLSNAQLYRQAEDRRKAAQILGKMAFGASTSIHELKTHIGAVRFPLQMISMVLKDPERYPQDDREAILRELDKGSNLFRHLDDAADLLDNLHEPWRKNNEQATHVNVCIERALRKVLPEPDAWVTLTLQSALPQVYTATNLLIEAFHVLIKNAVEAIYAAGGEGTLKIVSSLYDQFTIEVAISDTGIGIKADEINRIFDMGWTTKENGLGFGLFWMKDYIESLGGTISVQSIWRAGTTFVVRLPVIVAAA
jgi:signal transduction histidine kinase